MFISTVKIFCGPVIWAHIIGKNGGISFSAVIRTGLRKKGSLSEEKKIMTPWAGAYATYFHYSISQSDMI
jgi:hypothetical protein